MARIALNLKNLDGTDYELDHLSYTDYFYRQSC